MELTIHSETHHRPGVGDIVALKPCGPIDQKSVQSLEATVLDFYRKGICRLILDLSETKYLNSTGLGLLINIAHRVNVVGGGVRLINVAEKFKVLFDMLGLESCLPIIGNYETALNSFGEAGDTNDADVAEPAPQERQPPSSHIDQTPFAEQQRQDVAPEAASDDPAEEAQYAQEAAYDHGAIESHSYASEEAQYAQEAAYDHGTIESHSYAAEEAQDPQEAAYDHGTIESHSYAAEEAQDAQEAAYDHGAIESHSYAAEEAQDPQEAAYPQDNLDFQEDEAMAEDHLNGDNLEAGGSLEYAPYMQQQNFEDSDSAEQEENQEDDVHQDFTFVDGFMVDESVIPKEPEEEEPEEEEPEEEEPPREKNAAEPTAAAAIGASSSSVPENFGGYAPPLEEKQLEEKLPAVAAPTISSPDKAEISNQQLPDSDQQKFAAKATENLSSRAAVAEIPKTVYQIVNRKVTIKYYSQMQPSRTYPLSITFSGKPLISSELHESVKKQPQDRDKTLQNPFLIVVPRFPGCQIVPEKIAINVSYAEANAEFWVTLNSSGGPQKKIPGWMDIYYQGKSSLKTKTPFKVVSSTWTFITALCTFLSAALGWWLHLSQPNIQAIVPAFHNFFGADRRLENFWGNLWCFISDHHYRPFYKI